MKKNSFLIFLTFCFFPSISMSQNIGEWKGLTSFRTVNDIALDNKERIWSTTNGGVLISDDTTTIDVLTVVDGLSRLNGTSIHYDLNSNSVFVGYVDGGLDMINPEDLSVLYLDDIKRSSLFTSKAVNDITSFNNSLFVATSFGLVEYDLTNLVVTNTYLKFGIFSSAIGVNRIKIENDTVYIATPEGIAYGSLNSNLAPDDWENYNGTNGFVSENVTAIEVFNSILYASTSGNNYKYDGSNWVVNNDFGNNIIIDYEIQNSTLLSLSERNIFIKNSGSGFSTQFIAQGFATKLASNIEGNNYIFGTLNNGLAFLDKLNNSISIFAPKGPFNNSVDGINFDDDILIASSTQKSSGDSRIDKGKGFYIFDGSIWENYNRYTNSELNIIGFQQAFTSLVTDSYYYFGSWGRGVSVLNKETNELKVFDETNSTLRGWPADNVNFPVIIGLDEDSNNDVWAVSRYGGTPLYMQTPGDDDWKFFDSNSAISGSDLYEGLFIDSFDQKWIPLQNAQASGTGLLVLDTKNSEDESDDVGVKLEMGSNTGNLPDNKVNAIIEDKNGEIWIGTERGIAKFIFPELIINGSAQERSAQWLINEDTSVVSRFLLRDVDVSTMAVNSANEKWIGSANQGVWVLNAEGSKIIKRFTTQNSPLFSNTIKSIGIDEITGIVYIATDVGLISYQDVSLKPVSSMKNLKVFPNPFSYSKNSEIIIEGLSDKTSIKVLGVDGTVVHIFETEGGRTTWNGLSSIGNKLGTGVYYIVAIDEAGGSKGIGKVIVVK